MRFWFNSLDHGPPHFHAEKTDAWGVKVYFLDCGDDLIYEHWWRKKHGPTPAQCQRIRTQVVNNREQLYLDWQTKVSK